LHRNWNISANERPSRSAVTSEADSAFKGKVKTIGTCAITYYSHYDENTKPGKLKSIGTLILDYYSNYDNAALRGKLRFLGSSVLEYYSSLDDEAYRGKLKSIGSTPIVYYSTFDDKLIKGKIKITECDTMDNELIKDILTAPDLFGDLSLDGSPSPDEFAEALTANTVVCVFNSSEFKKILSDNPLIALSYANIVNNKLKKLEHRHSDLVFRDAKSRLMRFMKSWAQSDGNQVGDKIILNNYLTHSDIAGVISTSRQSVNVLLNELRDAGMLFYNRKKIELNNPLVWN